MRPQSSYLAILALAGSAMLVSSQALAAVRYWDGTSTTADADGGDGTWQTVGAWDSAATAGTTQNFVSGTDTAVFGGLAGIVSLNAALTNAGALLFNTSGYTIQSNDLTVRTLTLNTGTSQFNGTTFASTVNMALATGTHTIGLTGTSTINGVLSGAQALTTSGSGTLVLANTANTFSGKLSLSQGTVEFNTIANVSGGASSLGNVTTAANGTIDLGTASNQDAALVYSGTGNSSTNRVINLGTTNSARVATIEVAGTGNLTFTSAFTSANGSAAGQTRTLNLQGSNTGVGDIAAAIPSGGTNMTTSLTKNGTGTWRLSGSVANVYAGLTTVNGGTLELNKSGAVNAIAGGGLTIGGVNNIAATVRYTGTSTDMMGAGAVTIRGRGILDFNGKTDTIGNVAIVSTGATGTDPTSIINTAGGGNLTIGSLTLTPEAGLTSVVNAGTGTITLGGNVTFIAAGTGRAQISGTALALGSANRTFTIGFGAGATEDLLIDAQITGLRLLTKAGLGRLTLANTNAYTLGTTVSAGTLLLSGSNHMPTSGTLTVSSGGTFSLADGTARATTGASSGVGLALATGSTMAFDWNGGSLDSFTLTGTATATSTGSVGIIINNTSPTGSGGTLITATGLSTLSTANYFLANNTDYTATISKTATTVSIGAQSAVAALTDAYWKRNQVTGATDTMAYSLGTLSNWASDAAGTSAGGVVPGGSAVNVIFGATTATSSVTVGANMNLGSITFNDTAAVTIAGSNTITLNSTSGTAASTLGALQTVTAGSAISVTSFANATNTISANLALGANQTWNVASGKTLVVSGQVAGGFGLTKDAAGTLTLSGANTYTGGTTITAGTVKVGNATALGANSSAVSVASGAALDLNGFTMTNTNALTLNGSGIGGNGALINTSASAATYAGAITLGSTTTIRTASGTMTLSGGLSASNGTVGLIKTDGGTLVLSNAGNSYSGDTTVSGGTLRIGTAGRLGNGTYGGAISLASGATIDFNTTSNQILNGAITGTGNLIKSSTGWLTLGSTSNSYSGTTTLSGGILFAPTTTVMPTGYASAGKVVFSGGTLAIRIGSGNDWDFSEWNVLRTNATKSGGGLGLDTSNGDLVQSTFFGTAFDNTYLGGASFNLAKFGTNTLTLDQNNSFTGGLLIDQGTVLLSHASGLYGTNASANSVTFTTGNTGKLTLNGNSLIVRNLDGASGTHTVENANATAASLTIGNVANAASTFAGVIQNGTGGGALSLIKAGTGVVTLSGNNAFTGAVDINAGTLVFSNIASWGAAGKNVTFNGTGSLTSSVDGYSGGTLAVSSGTATISGSNITFITTTGSGTLLTTAGQNKTVNIGDASAFTGNLGVSYNINSASTIGTPHLQFSKLSDTVGSSIRFYRIGGGTGTTQNAQVGLSGDAGPVTFDNRQIQLLPKSGTTNPSMRDIALVNSNTNALNKWVINTNLGISTYDRDVNFYLMGGNTGGNAFNGTIGNPTGFALGLVKAGTGNWILSGNNSYTGATTITGGTLQVSSLANGGSNSNIGASSNAAGNLILSGGTLRYTGAAVSTNRLFSLQTSSSIDSSGTGAINFTNAGAMGFNTGVAAKTLTLTGTNTGNNTIAAVIGNNTGATAITKTGIGTWVLSGSNTNTGTTTFSGGGALVLDYGTNDNNKIAGILALGGGTLTLKGATGAHVEAVTSTSLNAGGTFLTRDGANTARLNMNVITRAAGGTISFGDATIADTDTNNFGASGANGIIGGWATLGNDWAVSTNTGAANTAITALASGSYNTSVTGSGSSTTNYRLEGGTSLAAAFAAGSLKIINTADSQALGLGTNNLTITSTSATALGGIMYAGGNDNLYSISGGTGRIVTSTASQELIFAVQTGTLSVGAFVGASGSTGGVTKSGAGTLVLSAANNYTGITRVNQGTLRLANNTGAGTTAGNINVQNGATLELANSVAIGTELLTITGSGVSDGGALRNVASNTSSYAGAITIGNGGARINSDASGALTLSGGVVTSLFNDVTFGGAGNTTVQTAAISGAGGLIKDGAGTLVLSSINSYTGGTIINDGILSLENSSSLGLESNNLTIGAGATLRITHPALEHGFSTSRTTVLGGAGGGVGGTIDIVGHMDLDYAHDSRITGTGSLIKTGSGTLLLQGTNNFTGGLYIKGGIVAANSQEALGAVPTGPGDSNYGLFLYDDATFQVRVNSWATYRQLTLMGDASGLAKVDITNAYTHTRNGLITGAGKLNLVGTGTLIVTAANNYSGGTLISNGVLQVGNTTLTGGSATGTGAVTVAAGGTLQGSATAGEGFITGAVTVESGGQLTASSGATLTLSGGLTLNNGSLGTFQLGSVTATPLVDITSGSFSLPGSGASTIEIVNTGSMGLGTYRLFDYAGTALSSISTLSLAQPHSGLYNLSLVHNTGNTSIDLEVTSITQQWKKGGVNTNWSSTANWWTGAVPDGVDEEVLFMNNNGESGFGATESVTVDASRTVGSITFDSTTAFTIAPSSAETLTLDVISGNANISMISAPSTANHVISTPLILADNLTVSMASGTYGLDISGAISGSGKTLHKTGLGSLTLSGTVANTYNGLTTVEAGTLNLNKTAGVNAIAGNLQIDSGATVALLASNQIADTANLVVSGTFAMGVHSETIAGLTGGGDVTIGTAGVLTINNSVNSSFAGVISGTGGLAKSGTHTLLLNGHNTYTGGTAINGGILQVTEDLNLGGATSNLTFDGGTLSCAGDVSSSRSVLLNAGGGTFDTNNRNATLSGVISGSGALTKVSSGNLILSGNNTYTGATIINGGTIEVQGSIASSSITNNTTLAFNSDSAQSYGNAISGSGSLTKDGAGTFTLSGTNDYTGVTVVNAGTLQFATQASLYNNTSASWTAANINVKSAATLALNVDSGGTAGFTNASLDTLLTNTSVANTAAEGLQSGATLGLDTSTATGGTFTQGNAIANSTGANGGEIGVTKLGTGTLVLDKVNLYTGATTVANGTLAIGGSGSIANSSLIQINESTVLDVAAVTGDFTIGTAQMVAGTGTILATGKTVVADGTLSPGNSPGTLTQDGGTLKLGANGNINWQIVDAVGLAGTGYDTVNLTNGATVDLSMLGAGNEYNINLWSLSGTGPDANGNADFFDNTVNYAWTLFSTETAISGFAINKFIINVAANNLAGGFTNDLGGGTFSVGLADGGTDIVLNFTAIPEPTTALLGCLGLLLVLRRRRR